MTHLTLLSLPSTTNFTWTRSKLLSSAKYVSFWYLSKLNSCVWWNQTMLKHYPAVFLNSNVMVNVFYCLAASRSTLSCQGGSSFTNLMLLTVYLLISPGCQRESRDEFESKIPVYQFTTCCDKVKNGERFSQNRQYQ